MYVYGLYITDIYKNNEKFIYCNFSKIFCCNLTNKLINKVTQF